MDAAVSEQTRSSYNRAWKQFCSFCSLYNIPEDFPVLPRTVLRFVAHLFQRGYAASSIQSAVAAINSFHRLNDYPEPSNEATKRALVGIKNLRPSGQGSLPIPIEMLDNMLLHAQIVLLDPYISCLFKAMLSLAFFALLRVGEFTFSKHNLLREDITNFSNSVSIRFKTFKYSQGRSFCHTVNVRERREVCPVHLLNNFLRLRGNEQGFLFIKADGRAPSRSEFLDWMRAVMIACGYNFSGFNTHSLRAGMATHMALQGFSGEQIKLAGRWSSDAYKKYIRVFRVESRPFN